MKDHMMNYGKSKYRSARDNGDGGPYAKQAQTNFGGRMTNLDGGDGKHRQKNFENVKASISVRDEKSAAKRGTGSQDGY